MSANFLQLLDPTVYLSLAFLFGIAAQFEAMDGDTFLRRIVATFEGRVGILYSIVIVASLFSPFILNDVVVLILTPVIVRYAKQFGVDAAPINVAEISFVNIATTLTPFGNPQNILLWTTTGISVIGFISGTWLWLLASGALAAAVLLPFGVRWCGQREFPSSIRTSLPALYLALAGAAVVLSDFYGFSPYVPLGLSFLLGFAFAIRTPLAVLRGFGLRSLAVLYVFVGSVSIVSFVARPVLATYVLPAAQGVQPYSGLFMAVTSNLISNVPATQLVLSTATVSSAVAPKLDVEAGLAGNLDPVG
jgi:Na+/H+ antiporter NhaD/arsenite permease-like protein